MTAPLPHEVCDLQLDELGLHELTAHVVHSMHSEGTEATRSLLEEFARRMPERAERVAWLRKMELRLRAEADLLDADRRRLKARSARLRDLAAKASARARSHVEDHLEVTGERRMRLPGGLRVTLVANPERLVGPEQAEDWPKCFQVVRIDADRERAKAALRQGEQHPGLRLERVGKHLRWS